MRVLFTPYGGGSIAHIIRSLAIADELKDRGHEILFTSPSTKRHFIEKAGYQVFGKGHEEVNLNDEEDQSIKYFQKNQDKFIDWLSNEIDAAQQFEPDIIVNSPSFFGPITHLKLDIPFVGIINAQWLSCFKGLLGISKSKNNFIDRFIRKIAQPIFTKKFENVYLGEIRTFYTKLGITPLPYRRSDLYRFTPYIIPGVPEFEPIRKPSANIHYIGPLFWQGFEKEQFDPKKIFNNFSSKPFIYVSLGGSIYRKKSYQDLITALSNKTDWNIVLSLGPNFPRSEFLTDTDHLKIIQYVPGLKVCQYANAIINTASHGTVMQALWHGKPVIALPHNIDQSTIANRIKELELGVNLNKLSLLDFSNREKYFIKATQIPWKLIIESTEKILNKKFKTRNLSTIRSILRSYKDSAQAGANIIEKYASQR